MEHFGGFPLQYFKGKVYKNHPNIVCIAELQAVFVDIARFGLRGYGAAMEKLLRYFRT